MFRRDRNLKNTNEYEWWPKYMQMTVGLFFKVICFDPQSY